MLGKDAKPSLVSPDQVSFLLPGLFLCQTLISAHLTVVLPTYENVTSPIPLEKSGNLFHLKENPEKKIQVNPYSSSRINQVWNKTRCFWVQSSSHCRKNEQPHLFASKLELTYVSLPQHLHGVAPACHSSLPHPVHNEMKTEVRKTRKTLSVSTTPPPIGNPTKWLPVSATEGQYSEEEYDVCWAHECTYVRSKRGGGRRHWWGYSHLNSHYPNSTASCLQPWSLPPL